MDSNFITRVLYKTFTDAIMLAINTHKEPIANRQYILYIFFLYFAVTSLRSVKRH